MPSFDQATAIIFASKLKPNCHILPYLRDFQQIRLQNYALDARNWASKNVSIESLVTFTNVCVLGGTEMLRLSAQIMDCGMWIMDRTSGYGNLLA